MEPMNQLDDEEGLPEKLVIKNQQFHKEREQPPRFAQSVSFEYDYAMHWKALTEMKKQRQDQVDRNIKEAHEKLKMEIKAAPHHKHQVMLMRQDLMRCHEELLWRMEELHNQEVQKRKQLELRQEEEHRLHEEEMRKQEEMMQQQQEGFKGTLTDVVHLPCAYDVREQEIWVGQMAMGGATGINNRGAVSPTPVPPGTPAPPGPSTMMPNGALGLTPPTTKCFSQAATMEGIGAIGGTPPAFNHPVPGPEFAPNKCRQY